MNISLLILNNLDFNQDFGDGKKKIINRFILYTDFSKSNI